MASHWDHGAVRRLIRALGFSIDGLRATWRSERVFRVDVVVFSVFAPLALWVGHSGFERAAAGW